jgi:hypothetical protein
MWFMGEEIFEEDSGGARSVVLRACFKHVVG